jgi:iron complex transport system ATP-binding protein
MNVFSCHNLTIGYNKGKKTTIVQNKLTLSAKQGELICLIGPNGCGKSTLLRTLAGLQKSLAGKIFLGENELSLMNENEKAMYLSLVLTDKIEVEHLRVCDLVNMGRYPHTNWLGSLSEKDKHIADNALDLVHLSHKSDQYLNELSDGEKQRAMIAKALAQDTPLIFLDEPTAHLDVPNRVQIMLLLRRLARETKKTIVLSTHELDLALQAADCIWLMDNQGITTGLPEDLVLQGIFQQTFANENLNFHNETGSFSMHYPISKTVQLSGDTTQVFWTQRALARAGYSISQKAEIKIHTTTEGWTVITAKQKTFYTKLEEVLTALST